MNIENGTMQRLTTPMIERSSNNRSDQLSSKGCLNLKPLFKAEKPIKIDQHPFPTNTVEVSSKNTSRVKLLASESAQNKGVVDPKVQATTADVK
jgi:hypothetical protein